MIIPDSDVPSADPCWAWLDANPRTTSLMVKEELGHLSLSIGSNGATTTLTNYCCQRVWGIMMVKKD